MTKIIKKTPAIDAILVAHFIKMASGDSEIWDAIPDWIIESINKNELVIVKDHIEIINNKGVIEIGEKDDYLVKEKDKNDVYICKQIEFIRKYNYEFPE